VPESVLQPSQADGESSRILNVAGVSDNEIAYVDFVLDVKALRAQGKTNAEIRKELELSSSYSDNVIDFLRQRHEDLL
jgi:hypothetical protein